MALIEAGTLTCNDCGYGARMMSDASLRKGSTVREPGEALCEGCSSRRVLMMRAVDALPNNLADIRARRTSLLTEARIG